MSNRKKIIRINADSLRKSFSKKNIKSPPQIVEFFLDSCDFWRDQDQAYMSVSSNVHIAVKGMEFKRMISNLATESKSGLLLKGSQMKDIVFAIESIVLERESPLETANRFCMTKDGLFIHTLSETDSVLVNSSGIYPADRSDFKFILSGRQEAWEYDIDNPAEWSEFFELLSMGVESFEAILIRAFMLGICNPENSFPTLSLFGPPGSGKTTVAKLIKLVIDPSTIRASQFPSSDDDLLATISNEYLTVLDNARMLSNRSQDLLCTISTGASYSKRKLFTDNELYEKTVKRPLILTSLEHIATNTDFLDRCIIIHKSKIEHRKAEHFVENSFQKILPRIRGRILLDLQSANFFPNGTETVSERMVGFFSFVKTISGLENIEEVHRHSIQKAVRSEILENEIGCFIWSQLSEFGRCSFDIVTLREALSRLKSKSDRALGSEIRKVAHNMSSLGVKNDISQLHPKSRRQLFIFWNDPSKPSEASKNEVIV